MCSPSGCLPTLATLPIFWGLYRTLTNVASAGLLVDGFYFIPSLAGPTSLAQRIQGARLSAGWSPFWPWQASDMHVGNPRSVTRHAVPIQSDQDRPWEHVSIRAMPSACLHFTKRVLCW